MSRIEKKFKSSLFIINRECNLKCPFCITTEIDTKNCDIISVLAALDIMWKNSEFIVIMGGEPLLYKYIFEIIEYLNKIGADFTIVTNGTLLDEDMMSKLKIAGLKNITISYDYFKGLHNIKVTKLKKYFEDISVNIMYDNHLLGNLYNIIKTFTKHNIWSIIALYNYSTDNRKHYLINKPIEKSMFNEKRLPLLMLDIGKIINNFNDLLIHNSKEYIQNIPNYYNNQTWHCSYPHRLVVNNDLMIMPCEDFRPFKFYDIFCLHIDIKKENWFESTFVKFWKNKTKKCKGCYLPCYYDIEILTPLEIAHRGGKNVNYNDTGLKSCVRSKNREIEMDEEHICWFCGNPIKIISSKKTHCKLCGIMKCTSCGKCFCDATETEIIFLQHINKKYCCNEENLKNFNKLEFINKIHSLLKIDEKIVNNAADCIKTCSNYYNKINTK